MKDHRLGEPLPGRVAVFRALQLGDLLCLVPALRALRAALPDAEITLIGLPWAKAFVERFRHYVDGFREFPGYPGLPERTPSYQQIPDFLAAMQAEAFDLVLQMHGNGLITNPLIALLDARRQAGFFCPGQYCPDPGRFLAYPDDEPEIWRHLRLLEFLGVGPLGTQIDFPIRQEDRAELQQLAPIKELRPGSYVCVHPGARARERRWPPEQFAHVADALAEAGFRIVLTGTADEAPLTRTLAGRARAAVIDLAGKTSLGAMAALLEGARSLVCNDTGVSHIAAALGLPSVVICLQAANAPRWAPLDRRRHRVLCGPDVTPAEVLEQVRALNDERFAAQGKSPAPCQGNHKEFAPPCAAYVS